SPIAPALDAVLVVRSTGVKMPVWPGDRATIESPMLIVSPYFSSTLPSGSSVAWVVTTRVESKPRTLHQVTVYWSAAALTKIFPVPCVGSRSAKNGATRGGPVRRRAMLRSVLDLSSSPKVMLPSELTNAAVCPTPYNGHENGMFTFALSARG